MLRIHPSRSAAEAKSYYTEGFTREDYYTETQEILGQWGGKGAAILGLSGPVDRDAFNALCDNLHPRTGERLTARTKTNRIVGYDFNFNCPKSVSVLYAFSRDGRILDAVTEATDLAMAHVEANMETRVRKDGVRDENRVTGNLVRADFTHLTARPVDGIPDPHVHRHCYVFNATLDESENQWKAGQFRDLKAAGEDYESIFHNELAKRLNALGYETEGRGKSFEVLGVPESVNAKFSRRTQLIERLAEEKGITSDAARDKLGAATREHKRKDLAPGAVRDHLLSRLTEVEHQALQQVANKGRTPPPEVKDAGESATSPRGKTSTRFGERITPLSPALPDSPPVRPPVAESPSPEIEELAVQYAMTHCFQKQSVVPETELRTAARRFRVGRVDEDRLRAAIEARADIIRRTIGGKPMVTTRGVLAEEQAIVAWTKAGKGAVPALAPAPGYAVDAQWTHPHTGQTITLSDEQLAVVRHIVASNNRVMGIHGRSGTGKTTLMHAALAALDDRHHKVLVMTPRAEAAHETLPADGFKHTQTVAGYLRSPWLQDTYRGGVLWVDEAGMLSSRDLYKLVMLAEECHMRLIVSGDPNQHKPVDRGDAMRILRDHAGVEMMLVSKIRRQEGEYKQVVELLAEKRIGEAFGKLDEMGCIHEVPDADRYRVLTECYLQCVRAGEKTLIISPTHWEGAKVTEEVRRQLKAGGKLPDEREMKTLRRIHMTEAELRDARTYRPGWVIEMIQNAKGGFRNGERLTVVGIAEHPQGGVAVQRRDGSQDMLPVHQCGHHSEVFEPHTRMIATGERIHITRNGWSDNGATRLHNGSFRTVRGFTPEGDIIVDHGVKLAKDFAHLTYGYYSTSQAAQGKTVDRVIIAQSSASSRAGSLEQAYVCISRGKLPPHWFTDDERDLFEAVSATSERPGALDFLPDAPSVSFEDAVQLREAQERAAARIGQTVPEPQARDRLGNSHGVPTLIRQTSEIELWQRRKSAEFRRQKEAERRLQLQRDFEERKKLAREREQEFGMEM